MIEKVVSPLTINYNVDEIYGQVNTLYGVTQQLPKFDITFESLKISVNSNQYLTDMYLLAQQQQNTIKINNLQIQLNGQLKSYQFMQTQSNTIEIVQYNFESSVYIQDNSYMLISDITQQVSINKLIINGMIDSQQSQNYLLYNTNQDDKVTVQQLNYDIITQIPYIYKTYSTLPQNAKQITIQSFQYTYNNNNYAINDNEIEENKQYYISIDQVQEQYNNASIFCAKQNIKNINIIMMNTKFSTIQQLSIIQATQETSLTSIQNIKIIAQIMMEQGSIQIFNVYNTKQLEIKDIQITNTYLQSQDNVSTISSVNNQLSVSNINIIGTTYVGTNVSFGILQMLQNSNITVSQFIADQQSKIEASKYAGSVAAICYQGELICDGVNVAAYMDFKGYQAGAIIGSVFGAQVKIQNMKFSVIDEHRSYLSCPANINSEITIVGDNVTCPAMRTIQFEEFTYGERPQNRHSFNYIDYYIEDQLLKDSYNDSIITCIQDEIFQVDASYATIAITGFSTLFESVNLWQNVEMNIQSKIGSNQDKMAGTAAFLFSQTQSTTFYNCQSIIQYSQTYNNENIEDTRLAGFILFQDIDETVQTNFINCKSDITFTSLTESSTEIGTISGFIYSTAESNNNNLYYNCLPKITEQTALNFTAIQFQQASNCLYVEQGNQEFIYVGEDTKQVHACQDGQEYSYKLKEPITLTIASVTTDNDGQLYLVEYNKQQFRNNLVTVDIDISSDSTNETEISLFKNTVSQIVKTQIIINVNNYNNYKYFQLIKPAQDLQIVDSQIQFNINQQSVNAYMITKQLSSTKVSISNCEFTGQITANEVTSIGQITSTGEAVFTSCKYDIQLQSVNSNASIFANLIDGGKLQLLQNTIKESSSITGKEFSAALIGYIENGDVTVQDNIVSGLVDNSNTIKGGAMIAFISEGNSIVYDNNKFTIGTHSKVYNYCPTSIVSQVQIDITDTDNTCPAIEEILIESTTGTAVDQEWYLVNRDINDSYIIYNVSIENSNYEQVQQYNFLKQQQNFRYAQNVQIESEINFEMYTNDNQLKLSLFTNQIVENGIIYNCQQENKFGFYDYLETATPNVQISGFFNQAAGSVKFLNSKIQFKYDYLSAEEDHQVNYIGYIYNPSSITDNKVEYINSKSFTIVSTGSLNAKTYQQNTDEQSANCLTTTDYRDIQYTISTSDNDHTKCTLDQTINWFSEYSFIPPSAGSMTITAFSKIVQNEDHSYYVDYSTETYDNSEVLINIAQPQSGNNNKKVSLFGNVDGTITNLIVKVDHTFDLTNMQSFSIIYSPSGDLQMESVTVALDTKNIDHSNTEIFAFITNIDNKNVTLTNCNFESTIQAKTVSAIGYISNASQVTIDNLIVNAKLTVQQGSFIFYQSNYATVTIKNTNIKNDSIITGDMIAGIGYSMDDTYLVMTLVNIYGYVNAQTCKSAGIINYIYNSSSISYASMSNVTFKPGENHDNYYNCYTQFVLDIQRPENITCPEDTPTNYTVDQITNEENQQYENASIIAYAFDSGNYNNSIIENNQNLKSDAAQDGTTYCDFKYDVFQNVTYWSNIKLIGTPVGNLRAGKCMYYTGFIIQSTAQNTQVFQNCQSNRDYTTSQTSIIVSSYQGLIVSGYVLQQSSQSDMIFINSSFNMKTTQGGIKKEEKTFDYVGFVYDNNNANAYYIKCNSSLNLLATKNDVITNYYPYQMYLQGGSCKYIGGNIDAINLTAQDQICQDDDSFKWW